MLDKLELTSISGVVVATMFIVEILKRLFQNVSFFNKIPVFVYAGLIAVLLTFIANRIVVSDGSPLLSGSIWKLTWEALIAALGSSGFYTWLKNPQPVQTARKLGDNL